MENKYLRDFAIVAILFAVIALGMRDYYLYNKEVKVPKQSRFKNLALSKAQLKQIQGIETSIKDRKNFVFTVKKDPLEQNLIVKTMKDLEQEWIDKVQSMVRLTATFISNDGKRYASISYKGKNKIYKVGDKIAGQKITKIGEAYINVMFNGGTRVLKIQPIPEKPAELLNPSLKKNREINW